MILAIFFIKILEVWIIKKKKKKSMDVTSAIGENKTVCKRLFLKVILVSHKLFYTV